MELFFLFASLFAFVVNSGQSAIESSRFKPAACDFFSYENATKIIGGKVRGEDGGMTEDETGRAWRCTFVSANENSAETYPKLYFMLQRSKAEADARAAFEAVRVSDKKHAGFEDWPDVGDEAVAHTDGKGFQLVMIRKGANTIRLKVNPVNGASFDVVKEVAASLVPKMK